MKIDTVLNHTTEEMEKWDDEFLNKELGEHFIYTRPTTPVPEVEKVKKVREKREKKLSDKNDALEVLKSLGIKI